MFETDAGATVGPIILDDEPYPRPDAIDWLRFSDVTVEFVGGNVTYEDVKHVEPHRRTVVAGSRSITEDARVGGAIGAAPQSWYSPVPSELVHGGAEGVDTIADEIARVGTSFEVITTFEPRWDKFGPKAGPMRNEEMARYANQVIAVWDGASTGTRSMIDAAIDAGDDVYVEQV